jgi:hypothetical protein
LCCVIQNWPRLAEDPRLIGNGKNGFFAIGCEAKNELSAKQIQKSGAAR